MSGVDPAHDDPSRTDPPLPPAELRPSLSLQLRSFAASGVESWQPLLDHAVAADRAGIAKLVVSDHVAFGDSTDDYADPGRGGVAGGKQPTGPDGEWLEPLTLLSVIAGRTERVRLGTNILLAALRRPAVLAKSLSTLDVLSGGRVDLGVGVGWQQAEYDAAGLDFSARGRLLDHSLEVCRTLWTGQPASYRSDELAFDTIHQMPTPLQPGGVPIWVSGTVNQRSMRRLARFGSGWIPWGRAAADVTTGIAEIRAAVTALGRDPSDIAVVGTLPIRRNDGAIDLDATMASVERWSRRGSPTSAPAFPSSTTPRRTPRCSPRSSTIRPGGRARSDVTAEPSDVPSVEDWNRLLDGKVAVVTGGGAGIGGGVAELFAEHGALVEIAEIDEHSRRLGHRDDP